MTKFVLIFSLIFSGIPVSAKKKLKVMPPIPETHYRATAFAYTLKDLGDLGSYMNWASKPVKLSFWLKP